MQLTNLPQMQPDVLPPLTEVIIFLSTIFYCWTTEHTDVFEKTAKYVNAALFLVCVLLSVLLTLRSWTVLKKSVPLKPINDSRNTTLLPREQTEEWKGWMQAVILLYHYFGLSKNLPVYQVIRVLIAAYMFLTGYSHTTYFLNTRDFSVERLIRNLLRLNLLCCVLAYVVNKSWNFYYFPGLTTFWYLVIHCTMYCAKTRTGSLSFQRASFSLVASCLLVQVSLYTETGRSVWGEVLSFVRMIGGPNINPQELNFRLKLDSLMPYWGALLAVLGAMTDNGLGEWTEHRCKSWSTYRRVAAPHVAWMASSFIVGYFLAVQQFKQKTTSNAWHPFMSIVPVAAIVALRNSTPGRQQRYNQIFRWLGSVSLETYILQSHIWMTNDNKGLLRLGLFDRLSTHNVYLTACLDKLIITAVFLATSHYTAQATRELIAWLMVGYNKKVLVLVLACWMLNLHWDKLIRRT